NKLLFSSGSWTVNAEGRKAVQQLGQVLAQNPDISVLIEGHTDNVPYGGSGQLTNNWDLSTKRATSIVQILRENSGIDPSNLNRLLFSSGSWTVNAEGRKAVQQLGQVLAQNPDISVLIEGHTDNVPYGGSGQLTNNWDLSTKRATSIVQILRENSGIDPSNLT